MKKRVLSLFLSLALCVTVMPETVYAEEWRTPTVSGNDGGAGTVQNAQTAVVQSLIDAMPSLEELQAADKQEQQEIYEELQEAYDAYEALREEDKALIVGADCFESLFGWFNAQVSPLEGGETHRHCICGLTHQDIGDHTTESVQTWTAITDTDSDGTITMTELQNQITSGGYFYLTADVVQGNMEDKLIVNVSGVTAICLNGHEMKLNSWYSEGIYLNKNGNEATKLILTDCDSESKGAITFTSENSWDSMCAVGVQNGASFEMYGGSIKGMRRTQGGAGVRCTGYRSSFKMYGGSIQGNNNTYSYPSGDRGAAVYCGDNTFFTMYGGTITGNTHQNGSGGGVYCGANNTFTMLGGEISGNTAALNGGGVLVDGSMTIGGTARITGNTAGGKTGNLFLNGSNSVLNVKSDFTGEVGLAAFDGVDRQIVSREEGSVGTITYDAVGYTLDTNGTLKLDHTHAPGEGTTDRCATCNGLLVASVTPQTGAASYYTKAEDAMEAVTSKATVKLLRDADYNGNLEITQPMTLDLNGKCFYTVEGDVFIQAADVKILGNASADVEGHLNRKTWSYDYGYYKESPAAVTIGSTDEAVFGGMTLSKQGVVGVVTVLNGTFTMTDGRIYGLVSYKKGDTKLSGGTISEHGSGITIKGEGYTIKDLFAEECVLLAVKGGTSSPVTEEQLAGTTLTTLSGTTSYKIAKPGFESVSISGGNQTVRYGENTTVTLTAVPVMADGYNSADVTYLWEQDGKEVQDENTNCYVFGVSEFGSKAPVEGGTEPAPYVITCTMTCGGYSQTAETTITVLPKEITAGTGNVTLGSGSESFTYTGSALTPTVTLKDGENTVSPTEYELNYSNNLNAGIATVTFTDKPGGKYTVTGSVSFTIEKAENTEKIDANTTVAMADSYDYGGTLPIPQLTGTPDGGTVTYYYNMANSTTGGTPWSELTATTLNVGDTPYYVYAEIIWENYKTFTTPTTSFKVNKAKVPVTTWPTIKDVYVGDTLEDTALWGGVSPVTGGFTVSGTKSWNAAGSYETELTYTAASEDKDNYLVNTQKVTVNVIKRTLKSVESLTAITDKGYETPQTKLGLPAKVTVTTEDDKMYNAIPVTWSGYDPQSLKKQTLTGTLDISSIETLVQQPETPVTASIEVTLYMATSADFPDKTATYTGNPIAYSVDALPVGVKSATYEYEGTEGTEYTKTFDAPTNAGKYNIIVRFTMEEGQTQLFPVATQLNIGKAQTPDSYTVAIADFAYGTPSAPVLSQTVDGREVTYYYSASNQTSTEYSTKWTESAAKTQSVGDYYLFAVIEESENYQAYTTATQAFTISQAEPVIKWPTVSEVYVGDTLDESYLGEAEKHISGVFTITGEKSWTESGAKTTTLTFTANPENHNYVTQQTKEVSVEVIRRCVCSTNPSGKIITDKEFGTAQGNLGLPATVTVIATAHNGTKTYENIPVSWSGYNSKTLEIQRLTGTLDISAYSGELAQPQEPVVVKATVQLQEKTAATPDFQDKTVTYNGEAQKCELAAADIPEAVESVSYSYQGTGSTTYEASSEAPVEAGTYTVTASFTMKYGYKALDAVTATLTIAKASITATVQMDGYAYGTWPSEPGITGNAGDAGVTYYYSKTNSNTGGEVWQSMAPVTLDVGTYYLYAVVAEAANYNAYTTAPVKFEVTQGTPVVRWPSVKNLYVGETMDDTYLDFGAADTDGAFTITGSQKSWSASGTESIEITFTPTDTAHYKPVTKEVEVNVVKRQVATVTSELLLISNKDFGTALKDLGLPGTVDIRTADGKTYTNIPVSWGGYGAQKLGTQILTGTLDISRYSKELEQPTAVGRQPVTAEIQVTLKPLTAKQPQQSDFPEKTETYSRFEQKHELAADKVPAEVSYVNYEYEGINGTDYEKTTRVPTDAGIYTVTASFTMKYGYAQLAPVASTLTIARKDISEASIVLGEVLRTNGSVQTQTLASVTVGELLLTAEDYVLSGNTASEAGEYTLTISGIGNFCGDATMVWQLAEAEETDEVEEFDETEESEEKGGSDSGIEGMYYGWSGVNTLLQDLNRDIGHVLNRMGNTTDGAQVEGENINIFLPRMGIVPSYVLRTLCGKQQTLALQKGNGVALSVSGRSITERSLTNLQMLDLTADTNANTIPSEVIREKSAGAYRQVFIKDTGRFAVPVNLHINMGAENAGRYANFYRYNEVTERLEYCGSFKITENGQAMTGLIRGGSYFIAVTDAIPRVNSLFQI